jgi:uncharacterized protein
MRINRRSVLLGGLGTALAASPTPAQDITFFRIATGGTAGTYFPIGGLIANAISNPPGSRTCSDGGSCGVPGLVATAVASNGSVANVSAIASGSAQSGFTQSDVAYWAYNASGIYDGRPKVDVLRAIANLYPESFHLVARKGAGIKTIKDLNGKRISLDEPGSGTLVDARLILAAYGLTAGRHRRAGRDHRHRPRADRWAGGREPGQGVQFLRDRRDSRRRLQGRHRREDGERQRHLGDFDQAD